MARLAEAFQAFGKLVGLLSPTGSVRLSWLLDPFEVSTRAVPENRDELEPLFRALIDDGAGAAPDFVIADTDWEPFQRGGATVGFAWNRRTADGDPLRIGLGTTVDLGVGANEQFGLLLRLLRVQPDKLRSELGQLAFRLPPPSFLTGVELDVDLTGPAGFNYSIDVRLGRAGGPDLNLTLHGGGVALEDWDLLRLFAFLVRAGGYFPRLNPYIDAPLFPPFDFGALGQAPDFPGWAAATFGGGPEIAVDFLLRLRGLLGGNFPAIAIPAIDAAVVTRIYVPLGDDPVSPPHISGSDMFFCTAEQAGSGTFVGMDYGVAPPVCMLELRSAAGAALRVPLAAYDGDLQRPPMDDDPADLGDFNGGEPSWMELLPAEDPPRIRLFDAEFGGGAGAVGLDGRLTFDMRLRQGEPVEYVVGVATTVVSGEIVFPDGAPPQLENVTAGVLFVAILKILSRAGFGGAPNPVIDAIVTVLGDVIDGDGIEADSVEAVFEAVADVAGIEVETPIGDVCTVHWSGFGKFEVSVPLPDVVVGDGPFRFSGVDVRAGLDLTIPDEPLRLVTAMFDNARIAPGVASDVVGDLGDGPGFAVGFHWTPSGPRFSGGGRIPVQRRIGPSYVERLEVDLGPPVGDFAAIGVSGRIDLGPLRLIPYDLGFSVPYVGKSQMRLAGLGLELDAGPVKARGLLGRAGTGYIGLATVSVEDFFEVGAVGGWDRVSNQESVFLFASLTAPLGGPPFLFVTGIAGGFGYNRRLPPILPIVEYPFLQMMGADPPSIKKPEALIRLSNQFAAERGRYWVAAGLQFVSFGFIYGKLVVAIGFPRFEIQIGGEAGFGIEPVAYFELRFGVAADDERFLVTAGLTPNSYILHRDLFSVSGSFVLAVWYGGDHAGDFLLSIGGYHPDFPGPAHYPPMDRVRVIGRVLGFIKMEVSCYFAVTPKAIMAGAAVTLSAEFAGIGAGLDVYFDVYIRWDPFFIHGRMGVLVWFQFLGRHEAGVELTIYTPPLGGRARIEVFVVSFEIDFGADFHQPPSPSLAEVIEKHLGVPADPYDGRGARVAALSTAERTGLLRVDVLSGRTVGEEHQGVAQEGLDSDNPILVDPEFSFAVRTRLPLAPALLAGSRDRDSLESTVELALCREAAELYSKLTVTTLGALAQQRRTEELPDLFPTALFGEEAVAVQAGGGLVGRVNAMLDIHRAATRPSEVALLEGIAIRTVTDALPTSASAPHMAIAPGYEESAGDEEYPLPLGQPPVHFVLRNPATAMWLGAGLRELDLTQQRMPVLSRPALARERIANRSPQPTQVQVVSSWAWDRPTRASGVEGPGYAGDARGVPVMAIPRSPVRRAAMYAVELNVVEARRPADSLEARRPLRPVQPPRRSRRSPFEPRNAALDARNEAALAVAEGEAVCVEINSGTAVSGALLPSGDQILRAIYLSRNDEVLADHYYAPELRRRRLPARVRKICLLGQGATPAPIEPMVDATVHPTARQAVGVERGSTLTALTPSVFAAHGCVIEALSAGTRVYDSLAPVDAAELLVELTSARLRFPAVGSKGSLALVVEPLGSAQDVREQVRWRSVEAELRSLGATCQPDRAAFTMAVFADQPWSLDLDLGQGWRLCSAVWRPESPDAAQQQLASGADWDVIDDRPVAGSGKLGTKIDLKVSR